MGRQPFGLASPAAWLRADGHDVTQADLSVTPMPGRAVESAGLIAFFLPMHTATKLFLRLVDRIRAVNPRAHLCAYGLYAPLNERLLRGAGVGTILGGEFETGLCDLARRLSADAPAAVPKLPAISTGRQQFLVPDRKGLPPLGAYAQLVVKDGTRRVGYTEASRGCKHRCRHCPVVPVYGGLFRIVQPEIVLEDIRRQVGAGAAHITFGDPDFFNGPGHAIPIVEALHREWPWLSYDVTIKVSHLLQHRDLLAVLKRTNCAFVTSAIESLDVAALELRRASEFRRVLFRSATTSPSRSHTCSSTATCWRSLNGPTARSSPAPSNRWTTPFWRSSTRVTRAPISWKPSPSRAPSACRWRRPSSRSTPGRLWRAIAPSCGRWRNSPRPPI